ncbi:MAG: hypothetical protein WBN42_09610 [Ignavibacteriaceae bacterium]
MDTPQKSDKTTTFLFYFFMGQVILGMIAVVGYMIYSFIFN